MYCGKTEPKQIHMLLHNEHFDTLTSLAACYKRSYWCYAWMKGYDQCTQHRCESKCRGCCRLDCKPEDTTEVCCMESNRISKVGHVLTLRSWDVPQKKLTKDPYVAKCTCVRFAGILFPCNIERQETSIVTGNSCVGTFIRTL